MNEDDMPSGLTPAGSSLEFTERTIPDALLREHALAAGRWAVLNVIAGRLSFVDLETGEARAITAPGRIAITPQTPHRLSLDGDVRCRIDFFGEVGSD